MGLYKGAYIRKAYNRSKLDGPLEGGLYPRGIL